jgi:hypothetical protein
MNNLFSGNHLTEDEKTNSANTIPYSVSSEVSVKKGGGLNTVIRKHEQHAP